MRLLIASAIAALAFAACSSGGSSTTSTPTQAPASATISATPATVTLRPGDPAVYGEGIARLQQYVDAWARGDKAFMNEIVGAEDDIQSGTATPQLRDGRITSYQPSSYTSAYYFTLLVGLELHFSSGDTAAWGEGTNSRFVTFDRSDASSPFTLTFATSP
ncbi:MAG: hypothetical protein ABI559_13470 [Chloroflexota bacterium]